MSYLDALQKGEIPKKKPMRKRPVTSYDRFMERKRELLYENSKKNISVFKPNTFNDVKNLAEILKNECGLVVDLAGLQASDSQRFLDYLSGAVYALGGGVQRIGESTYLFTPKGIDIVIN